jgi:hypothetical protein
VPIAFTLLLAYYPALGWDIEAPGGYPLALLDTLWG